jgi:hypothetical protein
LKELQYCSSKQPFEGAAASIAAVRKGFEAVEEEVEEKEMIEVIVS